MLTQKHINYVSAELELAKQISDARRYRKDIMSKLAPQFICNPEPSAAEIWFCAGITETSMSVCACLVRDYAQNEPWLMVYFPQLDRFYQAIRRYAKHSGFSEQALLHAANAELYATEKHYCPYLPYAEFVVWENRLSLQIYDEELYECEMSCEPCMYHLTLSGYMLNALAYAQKKSRELEQECGKLRRLFPQQEREAA